MGGARGETGLNGLQTVLDSPKDHSVQLEHAAVLPDHMRWGDPFGTPPTHPQPSCVCAARRVERCIGAVAAAELVSMATTSLTVHATLASTTSQLNAATNIIRCHNRIAVCGLSRDPTRWLNAYQRTARRTAKFR